jgi:beta-glucanase (GH16 family)
MSQSLTSSGRNAPGRIGPRALLLALAAFILAGSSHAATYQTVWADEFDGRALDPLRWETQLGDGCPSLCGWGNNELQYYQAENANVLGGNLTITAREESVAGYDYTSARLRSKNLADFSEGRMEMRARLPIGQGIWPAFWMLFTDGVYGTWAASGEIDVMEYLGHDPDTVLGTIHYGDVFPSNLFTSNTYDLPSGNFNEGFHTFAVEWETCRMRWYVDNDLFATETAWSSTGGPYPAPFDEKFHLLMNMAVGGNLPGPPDPSTVFPQKYVIDSVRVLQKDDYASCRVQFDTFEHADPFGNGWFAFGGGVGGGGISPNVADSAPLDDGCTASLTTGWGSGGTPGFFGGFGRTNPQDLSGMTHFSFWIDPAAGQDYTLEINLQDDDDGDDSIPATPDGADDEFQATIVVSPTGPDAIAGGGWQRVSIPLSGFVDDNSFHFGGNGVFDPVATGAGGNGRLINVVFAVISNSGADVNFDTDDWRFSQETTSLGGRVFDDANADGVLGGAELGLAGIGVTLDDSTGTPVASTTTLADGSYSFGGLPWDRYTVRVTAGDVPASLTPIADPDGISTAHEAELLLGCSEENAAENFAFGPPIVVPALTPPAIALLAALLGFCALLAVRRS